LIEWAASRADLRRADLRRADLRRADLRRADLLGPPEPYAGPEWPGLRTAMMCAEAVWWRCHRQLTADALLARGVEVAHITGTGPASAHKLTEFARIFDGHVQYPGLV
jgi:pentapeptide repeat protein